MQRNILWFQLLTREEFFFMSLCFGLFVKKRADVSSLLWELVTALALCCCKLFQWFVRSPHSTKGHVPPRAEAVTPRRNFFKFDTVSTFAWTIRLFGVRGHCDLTTWREFPQICKHSQISGCYFLRMLSSRNGRVTARGLLRLISCLLSNVG